ncbi:MAG: hypothetical protein H7Z43_05960 [Clostridia bacterium]|nr:hypothetical protein [Deltaproteobacteria bacterium]
MTITRVDSLRSTTALQTTDDSQTNSQRRLVLNDINAFEKVKEADFSAFNGGLFTDTQRLASQERYASLSAEDKQTVSAALNTLHQKVQAAASGEGTVEDATVAFRAATAALSTASSGSLSSTSSAQSSTYSSGTVSNDTVDDVLAFGVGYAEAQTKQIADQLQIALDAKKDIREQSAELGDMITHWPSPQETSTQSFTYNAYDAETGKVTSITVTLTKAEAEDLKKNLDGQVETFTELTQMMQFDLQQKYQDQQQTISVLSEIMKSMHDTMKNTIAHAGGS